MPLGDFFYSVRKDQMTFSFSADSNEDKIKAEKVCL